MRYFKTSNATRQYRAGGWIATFEPIDNVGGSWLGLLAVESDSAASQLVFARHPQIAEITQAEYEELKKKAPSSSVVSGRRRPMPARSAPVRVAEPAVRAASMLSAKPVAKVAPVAPSGVQLKSARLEVPDELRLETGDRKL